MSMNRTWAISREGVVLGLGASVTYALSGRLEMRLLAHILGYSLGQVNEQGIESDQAAHVSFNLRSEITWFAVVSSSRVRLSCQILSLPRVQESSQSSQGRAPESDCSHTRKPALPRFMIW